MNSSNKTARTAGAFYLAYIVITILGSAFGAAPLIKSGDAAGTVNNILTHEAQFRLGILIDLFAALLFLLTAWALYALLKPVNKNLALLFLLLNLGGVVVQCLSDLFLFAPLVLINGSGSMNVFPAEQVQALVMFFLDLNANGFMLAQLFFAAWLFPLGTLVFKSGFLPKILGIILLIHFFSWSATFVCYFLFPGFTAITFISYPLGLVSEAGLTLWLLIKGTGPQALTLVESRS